MSPGTGACVSLVLDISANDRMLCRFLQPDVEKQKERELRAQRISADFYDAGVLCSFFPFLFHFLCLPAC
jgi:hypothetical protein